MEFIKKLLRFKPWQMSAAIVLMIIAAGSEGISLLFLQPLLELANINSPNHLSSSVSVVNSSGFSSIFFKFFHALSLHYSLIGILLLYVGLLSVVAFSNYIKNRLNGVLQLNFACDLQEKLYNNFILSSWQDIGGTKRSDFNQLLTHAVSQVSLGIDMLIQLISTVILAAIYVFMAMMLSWQLTLVAVSCAIFLYIILHFQTVSAFKIGQANYDCFQQLYGAINNHLVNAKLAKSYCLEKKLIQQFNKTTRTIMKLNSKFIGVQEANTLLYTIGGAVAFSVIFYFALNKFNISLAALFVLLLIFARLVPRISAVQQYYQHLVHALPSFTAIEKMTQRFARTKAPSMGIVTSLASKEKMVLDKDIRLENVGFSYAAAEKYVFHGLNLTISARQITAILGHSGVGKSTLIDIIIGLLKPTEGRVLIDGKPLLDEHMKAWHDLIAYVPQDDYLLYDTIRNNLLWVVDETTSITDEDINEALRKAGIYTLVQGLPDKLETFIGDDGFGLSGGEKQRIILARALLRKPLLLILDEATNALDKDNENRIFETIYQLRGHLTVIIATHHETVLGFADSVCRLS